MENIFQKRYIPNYLTIIRTLIVPIVLVLLFMAPRPGLQDFIVFGKGFQIRWQYIVAGALFLFASITDILDGYLARKYKWVSLFGKVWDPIADKLLVNLTVIALAFQGYVPVFVPIVFIFRDTIVDAYRMSVASLGVDVSANWWGKAKTITQMIGIVIIFFCIDSINQSKWEYWVLQNGFLIISVFLSIVSGIIYIFSFSSRSRNFLK